MPRENTIMSKLLLSIIIPVYNTSHYLDRCINSILSQEGNSYEIILIDDGSTDESSKICDAYGRKCRNVKVAHQRNAGVSSARNHGLALAGGKYIWFCDSDDRLLPHALEKILGAVRTVSPDIIIFPVVEEDSNERALGTIPAPEATCYVENGPLVAGDSLYLYAHVIKREVIKDEKFNPCLSLLEDRDFLYRVCCRAKGRVVVLDTPLYAYFITRENSAINSQSASKYVDANIVHLHILETELRHSRRSPAYEIFVMHTLGVLALVCKRGGSRVSFDLLRDRLLSFDYLHDALQSDLRRRYLLCKYCPGIFRALYAIKGRISKTSQLGSTVIGDTNPM